MSEPTQAASVAPVGMCVVTEFYDAATDTKRLRIDQADQSIEITDEMLAALAARGWADGELFRIEAENGSVTYALNGRHPFYPDCWRAERRTPWPHERVCNEEHPSEAGWHCDLPHEHAGEHVALDGDEPKFRWPVGCFICRPSDHAADVEGCAECHSRLVRECYGVGEAACPDCLHPASSHGHAEGCAWSYDLHAAEPPLCGCPATQREAQR